MPTFERDEDIAAKIGPGDFVAFGYVHSGFDSLFEVFRNCGWDKSTEIFIPCIPRYRQADIFHLDKVIEGGFGGLILFTQITPEFSRCVKPDCVDIVPLCLSMVPRYLQTVSSKRKTWLFCEVSPPDEQGMCNTGYSVPFPLSLYKNCRVVGMINEKIPRTYGDTSIPVKWFDYFTPMPDGLPLYPELKLSEVSKAIALNASELIHDNSTIQGGIGDIASSVLLLLQNKKHLTFDSGLLPEEVRFLVERGVLSSTAVANVTAARSMDFYEWIGNNPAVEFRSMEYTHNIVRLSQSPGFTMIGGAMGVDLMGQVACETSGVKQLTGIGGALDFARASAFGNGRGIIAMTSVFGKDNSSKIVPLLNTGDTISMTRYDTQYIVTEHGIADLRYKSRREKALQLINVAHPDHRDWLCEEAQKINIL